MEINMNKPFKGEIHEWEKSNIYEISEEHLGWVIRGKPVNCPERKGPFMRTSYVVSYLEIPHHLGEQRKIEIETLNSRYHLIGEGEGL